MSSTKSRKRPNLDTFAKAIIRSKSRRNRNVAQHRTGARPSLAAIKEDDKESRKEARKEARKDPGVTIRIKRQLKMKTRLQLSVIIPKLGKIIDNLEEVVSEYKERLDQRNADSDLMTQLSLFLDCIIYNVRLRKDSFIGLDTEPEDPIDMIENLTTYIKGNIVKGYKVARGVQIRLSVAKTIVSIFNNCITEYSPQLYSAIAADHEEDDEEEENEEDELVNALQKLLTL